MTRLSATKRAAVLRRFSLAKLLERLAAEQSKPTGHNCPRLVEALEARVLLSIAPIATPDFILNHAGGTVRPAVSASPYGLTPATIRQAYGFNQVQFGAVAGDGAGQTIAIVDAYNAPTITTDLHAFDLQFNLTDPLLTVLGQNGTTTLPGADPAGPGNSWAIETSLDVEWAHVAAPKANILLVEAQSNSISDLFTAVNTARGYTGVSVVSLSWGGSEYISQSYYDQFFTTPTGHNGVTFVVSTGDSGAYNPNSTTVSVQYPAVSPNVLGVGGTYLSVSSGGNYLSESGWGNGTSSGTLGGSGGGLSTVVSQPAYQHGVVTQSTTARAVPDVAMDADPRSGVAVLDSWDFGATPWVQVGGTSLAAPLWAGVIALADQGRTLAGLATLDGATQTLPKIYALPNADFHDVTTGNNGYAAGPGYDLVTGRGTPIVNLLVLGLVGSTPTPTPTPNPTIGSLSVNPASTTAGATVTLTAGNVLDTTAATINKVAFYRESNGTSGLQIGSDTLLGIGTQNGTTWTLATATTGFAAGTYTYYAVATDSANVTSSTAATTLTIVAPAPITQAPSNDNFANATLLTGSPLAVTGTNINATKEPGEPNIAGNRGGKSVWWVWTATVSGTVALNTHGSSFDTLLGVYTGTKVSALTLVASNDDDPAGGTLTSALTFHAVAGTTYRIAVDGYNGASGSIKLNLTLAATPANDNFAGATVLTGTTLTWTGSNSGATKESGEPNHAGNVGGASVWFVWTATTGGMVSLNTHGSNFDTLLAVYTGNSVSKLTTIAFNDDDLANHTLTSALTFNAVAGTTYHFAVDGYNGATGNITLNLAQAAPAKVGSFANPTVLTGNTLTWRGNNNVPGHAVWFAWTAPTTRTVRLNTHGSNFDTILGVYTGNASTGFTLVASNDDDPAGGTLTSALTFNAAAGRTYLLVVGGYRGAIGNIALNLA